MANTFTSLQYHIIFSTKNGRPWIREDIEQRVWAFLAGIANENSMKALRVGGVEDHIHLLLKIPPTVAVSHAIKLLKGGSSKWVKDTWQDLQGSGWQDGYAAYTLSESNISEVSRGISRVSVHITSKGRSSTSMSRF